MSWSVTPGSSLQCAQLRLNRSKCASNRKNAPSQTVTTSYVASECKKPKSVIGILACAMGTYWPRTKAQPFEKSGFSIPAIEHLDIGEWATYVQYSASMGLQFRGLLKHSRADFSDALGHSGASTQMSGTGVHSPALGSNLDGNNRLQRVNSGGHSTNKRHSIRRCDRPLIV